MATLICVGIFVTTLASDKQLARLPVRSFIKNHLHLDPQAMAAFFFISSFAWYLKPLVGILSDTVPLFGTRRRSYLLLCSALGALCWILLAVGPLTYTTVLVAMTVANVMAMVGSTVVGGLIVDAGKQLRATGRLSSIRMVMQNGGALAAGPIGGWIAARNFRLAPVIATILMIALGVAAWKLLREASHSPGAREVVRDTGRQVQAVVTSWPLIATVGLTFLHYVAPGFDSLLYYHQQNVLKMNDGQIGMLGLVGGITAVLGALTYGRVCRRFNLRTLLYLGMSINAASILFYYGYISIPAAFAVEAAGGFVSMLGLLPLYDLSARATPRGSEALGYSLIMAIGNLAIALSDILGTYMSKHLHLKFTDMVWINAATTALILVFIPLLPRILVSQREGEATG